MTPLLHTAGKTAFGEPQYSFVAKGTTLIAGVPVCLLQKRLYPIPFHLLLQLPIILMPGLSRPREPALLSFTCV